jgi:alpha-glucosidase
MLDVRRVTMAAFAALAAAACGSGGGGGDADVPPDDGEPDDSTPYETDVRDATDESEDGETTTEPYVLEGDGIRVVVTRDPYGLTVFDGDRTEVLATTGAGTGDGYGSLAWTNGTLAWSTVVSPGYYRMETTFEPWRDDFVVVSGVEAAGRLELVLALRSDPSGPRVRVVHLLRPSTLRVQADLADGTPRAWAAAFTTPADEGFLGFGERFTRTNQRGLDVYSWTEEGGIGGGEAQLAGPTNPYPNGEPMTYYPVPFFVATRGYGFWLDSTWRNEFNLATTRTDAWRVWHIGPTLAYEVYVPIPADERPWPYQIIDLFTAATGRPMLPPAWTLGPRRRIGAGDMQGGVSEIQAMRDLDLAITAVDDATHFLPRGSHIGREAALSAWVADAAALGYRVNAYFNSFIDTDPTGPLGAELARGLANDWFLDNADGTPSTVWMLTGGDRLDLHIVDFSSAAATTWYQSMLQWALDIGYAGWMYDFGEYVQPGTVSASGMTGEAFHNLYPVLYARAAYETLEAGPRAGDWLTFVRAGYTGASQYSPMVWGGDPAASFEDSDGLPSMVRAGVNIGISGVPNWGGDINGFHCIIDGYAAATEELLVRWIQQGAMGANMQDQDACVGAMDTGRKANIFDDPAAQVAWRTYARLHTRLFPYLYTLANQAHATGAPLMRHVFLEHPDRTDLAGVDDAYYLGPALFVAPVVERGAVTKTVDLPAGHYLDWTDEVLVEGGAAVTLVAPLAKLPLLLRDGYLVPLLDPAIDTLAAETNVDVVGPADVDEVYDVVGLVSTDVGSAGFTLWDGGALHAAWTGAFAAPAYPLAADEAELSTCTSCYLREDLGGGLSRVRITSADASITAGGLALTSSVARTIRWDLYLLE